MGTTEQRQKQAKRELDNKLALSTPDRQLLEELAVSCANDPSPQNTFQYAFALSKSSEASELRYAINMLDGLVVDGYDHELDCLYGSATALYLLHDYREARARCENILRSHPNARFVKELHLASIEAEEEEKREQLKTAAMGSVAAAVAVGVIGIVGMMLAKGGKK